MKVPDVTSRPSEDVTEKLPAVSGGWWAVAGGWVGGGWVVDGVWVVIGGW